VVDFIKRSMAGSDAFIAQGSQAIWNDWTVDKSVKDGMKTNVWVYRAVNIIARAASTVPWVVYDKDMIPLWEHPLTKLLANPNPHYSGQRLIETLVMWLELSGNAYGKRVISGNRTLEIWPISPDRIGPIPSNDPAKFIEGYKIRGANGVEVKDPSYDQTNVIHLRFVDPSNPYLGIGPLQAAARPVDLDVSQLEWNVSTMQNRGIVDGVFTFKRPLDSTQGKSITERIIERFSGPKNARKPLVIGEEAQYTRLGLNPAELDFIQSRKYGREEILAAFGVPPQLVGIQDASSYNNFSTSMRIFWETTVIPLLDQMRDMFNHAFRTELDATLTLGYDTSGVAALQGNEYDKARVGKIYHQMGVPVSIINEKLALGIQKYPGWELSPSQIPNDKVEDDLTGDQDAAEERSFTLVPLEQRSVDDEIKLSDNLAETYAFNAIRALFDEQIKVLKEHMGLADPIAKLREMNSAGRNTLADIYMRAGAQMASLVAKPLRKSGGSIETRELSQEDLEELRVAFENEGVFMQDWELIERLTEERVQEQVEYGLLHGLGAAAIIQAILDTGVFSDYRARVIAQTTVGTASGIGQLTVARKAGATHKRWLTSSAEPRDIHVIRDGEVVPINARFSGQGGIGPRYPLDPQIPAGDRINCRCYMTFERRGQTSGMASRN
jgi:HK97 family phage portal protein